MLKDLILTSALILSFPKWQSVKRTGCCDHYGSQVKMLFIGCSLFPSGTFVPHKGYTLVMLPRVPLVKLCCYGYRWASPKNNSNIRSTYQSFFHHTSSLVQVFVVYCYVIGYKKSWRHRTQIHYVICCLGKQSSLS